MTDLLSRQVLARMTDKLVTVYLTDGNHITGRLSSVIVSGHRDDRGAPQGLHLVDLADGTPHDVAYVYLPHVVALAPAREQDRRPVARGDEPRPARSRRSITVTDTAGDLDAEAVFPLDDDLRVRLDRGQTVEIPGRGTYRGSVRRVELEWSSDGKPVRVELEAPPGTTIKLDPDGTNPDPLDDVRAQLAREQIARRPGGFRP